MAGRPQRRQRQQEAPTETSEERSRRLANERRAEKDAKKAAAEAKKQLPPLPADLNIDAIIPYQLDGEYVPDFNVLGRMAKLLRFVLDNGQMYESAMREGYNLVEIRQWERANLYGFLDRIRVARVAFGERLQAALVDQAPSNPILLQTALNAYVPALFQWGRGRYAVEDDEQEQARKALGMRILAEEHERQTQRALPAPATGGADPDAALRRFLGREE